MKQQALVKGNTSAISTAEMVGVLRRKCDCGTHTIGGGTCNACSEKQQKLQRRPARIAEQTGATEEVPSIVHETLRSPGQPLDAATRSFMEPRFGHDFSQVRVHTDERAAQSAHAVNALAYTVGHDIVFEAGQYSPQTYSGRRLLAHELTHVAQQHNHSAVFQGRLIVGSDDNVYEREADHYAERVMAAGDEAVGGLSSAQGMLLQRKCAGTQGGCVGGQWKFEYDGCSGLTGLAGAIIDATFDKDNPAGGKETQFGNCLPSNGGGRACDRHDECYQTCHRGGKSSQSECDVRMLEDMLDACSESESEEVLERCSRWAKLYYQILVRVGSFAYRKRQKQVCSCEYTSQPKESHSSTLEGSPQGDETRTASETDQEVTPESTEGTSESAEVSEGATPQGLSPCKPTFKFLKALKTGNTVMTTEGRRECEMGLGVPGSEGMTFQSEVEVPVGCTGRLEYLQLIDTCRQRRDTNDNNERIKSNGLVLDTRDPKAGRWVTSPGTKNFESSDSPGSPTRDSVYLSVNDYFHMWLLWRPDNPTGAARVPLGVVPWHWIAKTTRIGDTSECAAADWMISDVDVTGGTGVEVEHEVSPSPTQNVTDLLPAKGVC